MISVFLYFVNLFYFIICSYEDFKKKETYDFYTYSFIFFTLILTITISLFNSNIDILNNVLFSIVSGFFLGNLLFVTKIWGGGDLKFLVGISGTIYFLKTYFLDSKIITFDITNIFFPTLSSSIINSNISTIFLNFILVTCILIFIVLFFKVFLEKNKSLKKVYLVNSLIFLSFFLIIFVENIIYKIYFLFFNVLVYLIIDFEEDYTIKIFKYDFAKTLNIFDMSFFMITFIYVLNLVNDEFYILFKILLYLILLSMLSGAVFIIFQMIFRFISNIKKMKDKQIFTKKQRVLLIFFFILSFILTYIDFRFYLLFYLILIFILYKVLKLYENIFYISYVNLKNLRIGDWIVSDIKKGNKILIKQKDMVYGISESQINILKKNFKNDKSFEVKSGVAFIPIIFVGYILLINLNLFY